MSNTTSPAHRRLLPAVSSLLLILIALWLGFSALPPSVFSRSQKSIQLIAEATPRVLPRQPTPVFLFNADFFPIQCGSTTQHIEENAPASAGDYALNLIPYRSGDCTKRLREAEQLFLQPANLQLLWALLPADARENLAHDFWESAHDMGRNISSAFDTSYYDRVYRLELMSIVQDAVRQVMEDPAQQAMILETVRTVNPRYVDRYVDEIWPVVREKVGANLWSGLHGFAGGLIGWGGESGGSFTGSVLQAIAEDPRALESAFRIGLDVLGEPQVVHLTNNLGKTFFKLILADPRLPILLDRMFMDPQLFPDAHSLKVDLDFLVRELPKRLLRYRHPKDHNPLVAYLVRAIVRGDGGYVVLALNAAQAGQSFELGFSAGIPLHWPQP